MNPIRAGGSGRHGDATWRLIAQGRTRPSNQTKSFEIEAVSM
jgi:hypothetical protein